MTRAGAIRPALGVLLLTATLLVVGAVQLTFARADGSTRSDGAAASTAAPEPSVLSADLVAERAGVDAPRARYIVTTTTAAPTTTTAAPAAPDPPPEASKGEEAPTPSAAPVPASAPSPAPVPARAPAPAPAPAPSPTVAYSAARAEALRLLNAFRTVNGRAALTPAGDASTKAQALAEQMAAAGQIFHSNLTDGIGGVWLGLAENVALASSLEDAQAVIEASPLHRDNLLGDYNLAGIGVATSGGRVYVAQVFVKR